MSPATSSASSGALACLLALLLVLPSCAGEDTGDRLQRTGGDSGLRTPDSGLLFPDSPPDLAELGLLLRQQLAALGVDPERQTASALGAGNEVIDLEWALHDPDGEGPEPPDGYTLTWTERLIGDYDMNSEVSISDLTPIVHFWHELVQYDSPLLHGGIEDYPAGDPEFDGDVAPGQPPTGESGAHMWRLARTDGDGNGEVNIADIAPIGLHFRESLTGYRIYRRGPEQVAFERLLDASQPGQPLLVTRPEVDPRRPVRYSYLDQFSPDGAYEYRVAPYDASTDSEGPPSIGGLTDLGNVQAELTADVTQGVPPLEVHFDASATHVFSGSITAFLWDLNGDGGIDADTGVDPTISKEFTTAGSWLVSVEVHGSGGDTDVASVLISVTLPPVAKLELTPDLREAPLSATFDASGSYDLDGEVVGFAWDMDGDGEYELDTGPVPQRVVLLEDPGEVSVGVRVRDNYGATDSTSITVTLVDEYDEVEDNDFPMEAMELGTYSPGQGLAELTGGIGPALYDGDSEDWFSFDVEMGAGIDALLVFQHLDADLHLELYRSPGTVVIADATSQSDNETIQTRLGRAGRYFLRVYRAQGSAGGNAQYTLSLDVSELLYDELEDNDSADQPQNLGDISASLLPEFWGSLGPAGYDGDDEDWYAFSVSLAAGYAIKLHFFHEDADLELQLLASDAETLIGASHSVNNDEAIVADLTPGTYLVRCYRFEGGTANYWMSILYP